MIDQSDGFEYTGENLSRIEFGVFAIKVNLSPGTECLGLLFSSLYPLLFALTQWQTLYRQAEGLKSNKITL